MCDYPSFFSEKVVKARRPHRCGECGKMVGVGVEYERASGKWDGDVMTFSTCMRCVRLRTILKSREYEYEPYFTDDCGLMYGALWDVIRAKVDDRRKVFA